MRLGRGRSPHILFPWAAVAVATAVGPALGQGTKQNRAFLVFGDDDRTPVTAGHVVYRTDIGWPDEIDFIPGQNGADPPFGTYQAAEITTTPQWQANQDDNYDLALILLRSNAGSMAGVMRVVGHPPSFYENRELNLSGYPSDLVWERLYNASGQSLRIEGNRIHHYIDGAQGESGGPMWFTDPGTGQAELVGVYAGDVQLTQDNQVLDSYGYGMCINATFCSWISDYVSRHDPGAAVSCEAAQDAPPAPALPMCGTGLAAAAPM
jgi:V8-like Glu-specific endopeptidase